MERAIAKIGRENHLNHLIKSLPFVTIVFVIQCFVIHTLSDGAPVGDYAVLLALGLVAFVGSLVYYDSNHHVLIYSNYIHVVFPLFGVDEKILFHDIEEIIAPKQECNFATLGIKLKNDKKLMFYFVDYPVQVKKTLMDYLPHISSNPEESMDDAA